MIKQQNRKKNLFIIFLVILEFLVMVGAYAVYYFTRTRMGMLRHVVYLNGKWEKALPIQTIKWIVICIVIILIIFVYLHYRKLKVNSQANIWAMLLTIAISGGTIYYLIVYSTENNRAYYILSICYILITLIQNTLYYCLNSTKTQK